jgi:hypothetical protein
VRFAVWGNGMLGLTSNAFCAAMLWRPSTLARVSR